MKVQLQLNKSQWIVLCDLAKQMAISAPVDGLLLSSCVVAELYERKLKTFTFFHGDKWKLMSITFTASEAIAINTVGAKYPLYNIVLRVMIEPKLPVPRS